MISMPLIWETEQDRVPGGGRSWSQADRVARATGGRPDRDWGDLVKDEGPCAAELARRGAR